MVQFQISRGIESELPQIITDGKIYFCIDTGNLFIDYNTERIHVNANKAQTLTYLDEDTNRYVDIDVKTLLDRINAGGGNGEGGGGVSNILIDETLTFSGYAADAKVVGDRIGSLESLDTEEKTNLVAAINEVANKEVGSSVYVQDDEPENAVVGSLWLDTDEENGSGTGGFNVPSAEGVEF